MTDLFWPGDERAGVAHDRVGAPCAPCSRVEAAWLAALVGPDHRRAGRRRSPCRAGRRRRHRRRSPSAPRRAATRSSRSSRCCGRASTARTSPRPWLHRGLTSQDVLDTALMLCAQDVLARLTSELRRQFGTLTELADSHRGTVDGRPHAHPARRADHVRSQGGRLAARTCWTPRTTSRPSPRGCPSQLGGAAGTLAAAVELAALAGLDEPVERALDLAAQVSHDLGLAAQHPLAHRTLPGHPGRRRPGRAAPAPGPHRERRAHLEPPGDRRAGRAGRLRPGLVIGDATEGQPGAVGADPPAALTAPAFAAQLHLAAAECLDERPDGSWHTEWSALQALCRRTVVAASQTDRAARGPSGRRRADAQHSDGGVERPARGARRARSPVSRQRRSGRRRSPLVPRSQRPHHRLGAGPVEAVSRGAPMSSVPLITVRP